MRLTRLPATSLPEVVAASTPIRFTYLEEYACRGARARAGAVIAQRYELERPLLANGGGSLWHARRRQGDERECTIQLLDPAIAEDPGLLEAFDRQARAAEGVDHPHVARVLEHGVDSRARAPYLILERLEGKTLAAHLAARGRLSADELAHVFHELALGLGALHAAGLVQRYLDPARVFLSGGALQRTQLLVSIDESFSEHLRLVRGLSHQFAEPLAGERWSGRHGTGDGDTELGAAQAELDIPEYQSPEQLLGHDPVDERSDVWSLAVIAFEALTGTAAFSGASVGERLVQICSGAPNSPPAGLALPKGFLAWFQKGVSRRPQQRFGSARDMASALARVLAP